MRNLELIAVYYGVSKWVPDWHVEEEIVTFYECYHLYHNKDDMMYYVIYGLAGTKMKPDLSKAYVYASYSDATDFVESQMNIAHYASNIPF